MTESYRLIQNGKPIAWAEGPKADTEIMRYAYVHAQDGRVTIQKKVNGRWKDLSKIAMTGAQQMTLINIDQLNALRQACDDILGYLSDNSCSDPECCGGPYYDHDDFERGQDTLRTLNLQFVR
jgi:hypothetical protein